MLEVLRRRIRWKGTSWRRISRTFISFADFLDREFRFIKREIMTQRASASFFEGEFAGKELPGEGFRGRSSLSRTFLIANFA